MAVTDWVVELTSHYCDGRSNCRYNYPDRSPRVLLVRVPAWVRVRMQARKCARFCVDAGAYAGAGEVASAGVCACA